MSRLWMCILILAGYSEASTAWSNRSALRPACILTSLKPSRKSVRRLRK